MVSILLRLALCLGLALPVTQVLAHALPGTVLTVRDDAGSMVLTVTMPLYELDLAMPEGTGLGADPAAGPVPDEARARLSAYLRAHLLLTDAAGETINLRLSTARIERAYNDHVRQYDVLVIDLAAPAAEFPLMLHYDAILHEVRNHRAAVYLQAPGADPIGVGVLHIDPATGTTLKMMIPAVQ